MMRILFAALALSTTLVGTEAALRGHSSPTHKASFSGRLPDTRERELPGWQGEKAQGSAVATTSPDSRQLEFVSWSSLYLSGAPDTRIIYIHNFMTPAECEHLIAISRQGEAPSCTRCSIHNTFGSETSCAQEEHGAVQRGGR